MPEGDTDHKKETEEKETDTDKEKGVGKERHPQEDPGTQGYRERREGKEELKCPIFEGLCGMLGA